MVKKQESNFLLNRNEIAGSLGDLGLFVPIVAALVLLNGMNATIILLAAGLLSIASGLYFKIPIPVQPFKAVASIAIALSLAPTVISASGLLMGLLLAIFALTPLSKYLSKLISKPVVRGVQLTIGIFLIKAGLTLVAKKQFFINTKLSTMFAANLNLIIIIGLIALLLIIFLRKNRRIPAALVALGFGLLLGLINGGLHQLGNINLGPQSFSLAIPSVKDFYLAFILLVLPQFPMTLANSVIATTDTSYKYFGQKAKWVNPRSLLFSLSAANLTFGFFGSMPLCHGASGQTAQYRFGARTAGSNIFIGSLFILLGLLFGRYAITVLSLIPSPIYAALLIYLGFEHALLIRDLAKKSYIIPIGMGALALISSNLLLAMGLGYVLELILRKINLTPALQK